MFTQRAKLYKYDTKLNQWKERGIGELKIMSHLTQSKFNVDFFLELVPDTISRAVRQVLFDSRPKLAPIDSKTGAP